MNPSDMTAFDWLRDLREQLGAKIRESEDFRAYCALDREIAAFETKRHILGLVGHAEDRTTTAAPVQGVALWPKVRLAGSRR